MSKSQGAMVAFYVWEVNRRFSVALTMHRIPVLYPPTAQRPKHGDEHPPKLL